MAEEEARIVKQGEPVEREPVQPVGPATGGIEPYMPPVTRGERFAAGVYEPFQGLKQLGIYGLEEAGKLEPGTTQKYTQRLSDDLAMLESGRGEEAGTWDWMRFLGQMTTMGGAGYAAAKVMPAAAGWKAKMTAGAAGGAAGAASMPVTRAEKPFETDKMKQVGAGAVGGAAIPPVLAKGVKKLTPIARGAFKMLSRKAVTDKIAPAALDGAVSPYLGQWGLNWKNLSAGAQKRIAEMAKEQLDIGAGIDPKSIVRRAVLEDLGFAGEAAPMKAQVTRDPLDWATMRTGKRFEEGRGIITREQAQAEVYKGRISELGEMITGDVWEDLADVRDVAEEASEEAFMAINNLFKDSNKAISRIYDDISEEALDQATVLPGLKMLLETELADMEDLAPIIGYAQKRIAKYPEGMTARQAELFRRKLGELTADTTDKTNRRAGTIILKALDEDVIESLGSDVHAEARHAASRRFSAFSDKIIRRITGGNARADNFINTNILRAPRKQLETLKNTLTKPDVDLPPGSEALAEGHRAWDGIRSAIFRNIVEDAVVEDAGEVVRIAGPKIANSLKKIGGQKLSLIFNDEEVELLRKLAMSGEILAKDVPDTRHIYTGASLKNFMMKLLTKDVPFMSGVREFGEDVARDIVAKEALKAPGVAGVTAAQRAGELTRRITPIPAGAGIVPGKRGER